MSANKWIEKNNFSASDFCILHSKTKKLQQKGTLNIAISEPSDEEDLATFSLGLDFLTPEKQAKRKGKTENKQGGCLCVLQV